MVDFNSGETVATPAVDVKRILMLQDRQYLKEAIGAFKKSEYSGVAADNHIIRSRLYELFLEVRAGVKRHLNPDDYEQLVDYVNSEEINEVLQAYEIIDDWLDHIGLTKVDVKQKLGGNIADRNKAQGWKA
jgi:hypothetical protein